VLRRLADRWAHEFNWSAVEAAIDGLPWRAADIDGSNVRYLRFDPPGGSITAILLLNGWPSTFLELVPLARLLVGRQDGEQAFTVIVPVLPGFPGAEQPPALPPEPSVHELWHRLMRRLGFDRYVVHGGDLGAGTASRLAQAHPEAVAGLHLLAVADPPDVDRATITAAEQDYLDGSASWFTEEGAYEHQQMTRPVTLGYGLSDSPVGMLAWIVEKYHAWTDHPESALSALEDDLILTQASLYWFSNSIATSFRPYFEYAAGHADRVRRVVVPTAVALFPKDLAHPPRSWAARTYEVIRYTRLPHGGHFAALEVPGVLEADIRAFVAQLDDQRNPVR
jgi:pimeloyl-ACP methyl ester carboxylesterase